MRNAWRWSSVILAITLCFGADDYFQTELPPLFDFGLDIQQSQIPRESSPVNWENLFRDLGIGSHRINPHSHIFAYCKFQSLGGYGDLIFRKHPHLFAFQICYELYKGFIERHPERKINF